MQLPNQSRSKLSYYITIIFALLLTALVVASCQKQNEEAVTDNRETTGASTTVQAVAEARGLTPDDILAAVKTYTPTGMKDEYIMFASGGHAGQVFVIGLPSMRLLKSIAVFTPEPWQGYGYGASGTMNLFG